MNNNDNINIQSKFEDIMSFHIRGDGNDTVLFLHGWGSKGDSFTPIIKKIDGFKTVTLDFPGFGNSKEPKNSYSVDDYTALTHRFITDNKLKNIHIFAHSFGGRVAIKLASNPDYSKDIKSICLTGAAGIKPKRSFSYYLKVYSYKTLKILTQIPLLGLLFKRTLSAMAGISGSTDYQSASPVMKQTLSKVVNEDLTHLLPKINIPTLLIWGENDDATPLSDGEKMKSLIPYSELIIIKKAGHFAYLEKDNDFALIYNSYLGEVAKLPQNFDENKEIDNSIFKSEVNK